MSEEFAKQIDEIRNKYTNVHKKSWLEQTNEEERIILKNIQMNTNIQDLINYLQTSAYSVIKFLGKKGHENKTTRKDTPCKTFRKPYKKHKQHLDEYQEMLKPTISEFQQEPKPYYETEGFIIVK